MKIAIIGAGYVGLSLAVLLSRENSVFLVDVLPEKINKINQRISPIKDSYIESFFHSKSLDLHASLDYKLAAQNADFIIICTPTNFIEEKHSFDTRSVESALTQVQLYNPTSPVIIKSTLPVGFTERMRTRFKKDTIYFSPEFLREGMALYDNLYPTRIIVGGEDDIAKQFAVLLRDSSEKPNAEIKLMSSTEAESVKLFANTFLAMRVAFFNELDTYAELKKLNTKNIIDGVCLDPRIGSYYNNPSFGYGGYCLPKDTKQLLITNTSTFFISFNTLKTSGKFSASLYAGIIMRALFLLVSI